MTQTDLPEPVVPAISRCGMTLKVGGDRDARSHLGPEQISAHVLLRWKSVAFQNIAQGHQRHLVVGHFDADVTMSRHRRLDADARRGQGERQVIGKGGDLVDAHFRASVPRLDEERLHAELRDRRSAVDLHHLGRRAEGCQRLLRLSVRAAG